jgi:hypothetical protein
MKSNLQFDGFIERLVAFCLVKGVQPDELVNSIFDVEYDCIETYKKDACVYLVLAYKEDVDGQSHLIKMRYVYTLDKQLQRVEQKIDNGAYRVQWDRIEKLNELIKEFNLHAHHRTFIFDALRNQLPEEQFEMLAPRLKLVS